MKGRSKSQGDAADASGRKALLEQLMEQYDSALLRYAMRILNSREAAQDVVQNTFIKLFKGLEDGMEPSDKVRAWLYRVTHNEAIDYIRRESRFRAMQDRYQDAIEHGEGSQSGGRIGVCSSWFGQYVGGAGGSLAQRRSPPSGAALALQQPLPARDHV